MRGLSGVHFQSVWKSVESLPEMSKYCALACAACRVAAGCAVFGWVGSTPGRLVEPRGSGAPPAIRDGAAGLDLVSFAPVGHAWPCSQSEASGAPDLGTPLV